MLRHDPSKAWDAFGRVDPYYGVCTAEEFRREKLSEDARARFFASGDAAIETLLQDVRTVVDPGFRAKRALEYGCGVGRLLIPVAKRVERSVGVDVSRAMLAEARRNCAAFAASGVELITPEELAGVGAEFDLIYSVAVLQHIPQSAGEQIVSRIAGLLRPGGVAAINLVLRAEPHLAGFNAVMKLPLAHNVLNVLRGRRWSYPCMQMNVYDLNRIAVILRDHGVQVLHVKVGSKAAGFDPCMIFFSR